MTDPIISVRNLGKRYRLGQRSKERYIALRDVLTQKAQGIFRRQGQRLETDNEIWALKHVSFEVKQSEVVGIIGRNGAGKSTLLKVLSRITDPTEGRVRIKGRVASLLEVGTGFHPELTGRENIFLNGAILGMTHAGIRNKFDEIVAFAEIEKFLDTPVKRYSTGMYVRLAFAVAAHLEPEILVVDEVLAVGDAAFQTKCLGKMKDVSRGGRTVLFVSHNLAVIAQLCYRCILLDQGHLTKTGKPAEVVHAYLSQNAPNEERWSIDASQLISNASARITSVELRDLHGDTLGRLATGDGLIVRLGYAVEDGLTIPSASFVVRIKSDLGVELFRMGNTPLSGFPINDLRGRGTVDLVFPTLHLSAGQYSFDAGIARMGQLFYHDATNVGRFTVEKADVYNSGYAIDYTRGWYVVPHRWIIRRAGSAQVEDSGWIAPQLLSLPEFKV